MVDDVCAVEGMPLAEGEAAQVPVNLDDIDPLSMTPDERNGFNKLKWVWCYDCAGGSISKVGWAHKNRAKHNVESLKKAGKVDVRFGSNYKATIVSV